MGEAKQRREAGEAPRMIGLGATVTRRMEMDDAIAHVENLVEAGQVEGFVQLALVRTRVPGVHKVELLTLGEVSARQAWDMLKIVQQGLRDTMGFKDDDPRQAAGS